MIAGVGGLQEHDAVFGIQTFFYALKRLLRFSAVKADPGHDAHSLGLDIDLALFIYAASDGIREGVIGTDEPFSVPAGVIYRLFHGRYLLQHIVRLFRISQCAAELRVFPAVFDEHAGDEDRFRHRSLAGAEGLEALARFFREAVEIQAVVPVRPSDERQRMRPEMGGREAEASAEVLHKRQGF